MRAPRLARAVQRLIDARLERPADFRIGEAARPYMLRWFLIPRNRILNVYHHVILRSDDDRALHDHPWWSLSIVLEGSMLEVLSHDRARTRLLRVGDIALRGALTAHRLEVRDGWYCKTLFITGPKIRSWGFHCPQGWRHWRDFVAKGDTGSVGRRCGEIDE